MGKSQKTYMSIKSKLMAAVAMLLVASFMVVSSTYAWFTLSTAPEVTGITTRVGANGSLEIALYTGPGADGTDTISSNVGDSNKTAVEKNKTWGNIISLDDEAYGLDKIMLLPSVLRVGADGTIQSNGILATPEYGADGRITTLVAESIAANYDKTKSLFSVGSTAAYGVKAIGTTSGMSQQELLHRAAYSDIKTNLNLANKLASDSLAAHGGALAKIVLAKADGATSYDIEAIGAMLRQLAGLDANYAEIGNSVADYLEKAMMNYLIASAAVAKYDLTDDAFAALATLIKNECTDGAFPDLTTGVTIGDYTATWANTTAISLVYQEYVAIKAAIDEAVTDYRAVQTPTAVDWTKVNGVLTANTDEDDSDYSLVYVDGITVNGFAAEELKAKDPVTDDYLHLSDLMNDVMNGRGVQVQLGEGTGTFFDIAQATDKNVVAAITMPAGTTVAGVGVGGMKATMTTVLTGTTTTGEGETVETTSFDHGIDLIGQTATTVPEKGEGVVEDKKLADYYGYAIDLAFRTNATNSNLMLQTTAANRIYSDSTNEQIMGNGSTMTFGYSTDFNEQDVANLMKSIRIVFADSKGAPIAYAGLDAANATLSVNDKGENVITASIKLYDGVTVKSMSDGTASGTISYPDFTGATFKTTNDKGQTAIVALEKNTQTVITAYVYLDGTTVDNGDVATGTMSMTGSMNLQFSSDADLTPMSYAPLQGTTTTETTQTEASSGN
ncbi:MAG: hypothetical protein IJ489_11250 [Clostridia bacterium]|nr:hypothetical protein [Clostridia bacterium]